MRRMGNEAEDEAKKINAEDAEVAQWTQGFFARFARVIPPSTSALPLRPQRWAF